MLPNPGSILEIILEIFGVFSSLLTGSADQAVIQVMKDLFDVTTVNLLNGTYRSVAATAVGIAVVMALPFGLAEAIPNMFKRNPKQVARSMLWPVEVLLFGVLLPVGYAIALQLSLAVSEMLIILSESGTPAETGIGDINLLDPILALIVSLMYYGISLLLQLEVLLIEFWAYFTMIMIVFVKFASRFSIGGWFYKTMWRLLIVTLISRPLMIAVLAFGGITTRIIDEISGGIATFPLAIMGLATLMFAAAAPIYAVVASKRIVAEITKGKVTSSGENSKAPAKKESRGKAVAYDVVKGAILLGGEYKLDMRAFNKQSAMGGGAKAPKQPDGKKTGKKILSLAATKVAGKTPAAPAVAAAKVAAKANNAAKGSKSRRTGGASKPPKPPTYPGKGA